MLFGRCPGLAPYAHLSQEILARFAAYKQGVPVMGAILLNPDMTKCLLVRGFHAAAAWGFPRGKIAKDETDAQCAIREVGCLPALCRCVLRLWATLTDCVSAVQGMAEPGPVTRQHPPT